MARLTSGINGPFIGKVGTVVGSSWNGIPYIKAKPGKRTKRVSEKERQNRSKFSLVHYWLQPLLGYVREGFKNYSEKSRGYNAAKSYVLENAVEGVKPGIFINPALVKVSAGTLPLPTGIAVEKSGPNLLTFTWDKETVSDSSPFDQAMVLAYNIEDRDAHFKITGHFRHTGSDILGIRSGKTYHIYLAFTAADRSRQSDSVYLGEIYS